MTLNQVIAEIKKIVSRHRQIEHFYFGEPVDWTAQKDLTYPACLLVLNDPVNVVPADMEMTFSFFLADRVFASEENVNDGSLNANSTEVQSDMLQVAFDLISELQNPSHEWIVNAQNIPIDMYSDVPVNEDVVAGCKFEVTLRIPATVNRCQIPFED